MKNQAQADDPLAWVVRTKLQPPQPGAQIVARPRLTDALGDAIAAHRLTLLTAPAGYGKTTALVTLAAQRPDLSLAWLTLDPDDDDPGRFLAGLIAALRRLAPDFAANTVALLTALPDPGVEIRRLIGVLINDLVTAFNGPFALVLDDLHLLHSEAISTGLGYLIERAPAHLHLVIATRHEPPLALARLRARQQIAEFDLADLRFTAPESESVLRGAAGGDLAATDGATIASRLEGWPAGFSLLANALRRLPPGAERARFIDTLTIRERPLADYLAQEVLEGESRTLRDFIVTTALLDELDPALCAAVSGRDDAPALLDELRRRNLFVVTLDPGGATLRYHTFFRDFLRQQLAASRSSQEIRALHRRAASATRDPLRAIGHLLAAHAWDEAARAIATAGAATLAGGGLETFRAWLSALRHDVRRCHPQIALLAGIAAWERWDVVGAREWLNEARDGFRAADDPAGTGEAEVYLASTVIALADYAAGERLLASAADAPLSPTARVQLLLNQAWFGQQTANADAANGALDAALATAERYPEPRTIRILATQIQGDFVALPGGIARLARLERLIARALGGQPSPLWGYVVAARAWRLLWQGEREAARRSAEEAIAIDARFGGPEALTLDVIAVTMSNLLAQWHHFRGEPEAGDAFFARLFGGPPATILGRPFAPPWRTSLLVPLARVRLAQGELAEAREIAANLDPAAEGEESETAVAQRLLRGRIALAENRHDEAITLLRAAAVGQARVRSARLYGLAALPLTSALLASGRRNEALTLIDDTVGEHRREGSPGAILWEDPALLRPLLTLAAAHGPERPFAAALLAQLPGAGETGLTASAPDPLARFNLTAREREILTLLARGASNQAITVTLSISIHTVKRHVANVLGKLAVESRSQAAARARDLGIR